MATLRKFRDNYIHSPVRKIEPINKKPFNDPLYEVHDSCLSMGSQEAELAQKFFDSSQSSCLLSLDGVNCSQQSLPQSQQNYSSQNSQIMLSQKSFKRSQREPDHQDMICSQTLIQMSQSGTNDEQALSQKFICSMENMGDLFDSKSINKLLPQSQDEFNVFGEKKFKIMKISKDNDQIIEQVVQKKPVEEKLVDGKIIDSQHFTPTLTQQCKEANYYDEDSDEESNQMSFISTSETNSIYSEMMDLSSDGIRHVNMDVNNNVNGKKKRGRKKKIYTAEQEIQRRRLKREKNREASKRLREKKENVLKEAEEQLKLYEEDNMKKKAQVEILQQAIAEYTERIKKLNEKGVKITFALKGTPMSKGKIPIGKIPIDKIVKNK